jgi:hypothetical protein
MQAGAPNAGAGVAGAPKAGVDAAGAPNEGAGAGGAMPPLLAPLSFSCVLPYAAIPKIAPMAMWNRPAPCR